MSGWYSAVAQPIIERAKAMESRAASASLFPQQAATLEALVRAADKVIYISKKS